MKWLSTVLLAAIVATGAVRANEPAAVLKEAGVNGGLVVHLGCGDGAVTARLRISDATTVQGLDRDPANVHKTRRHIQSRGLYGLVSVDHLRGRTLPYVDNLVRALVVSDAQSIPRDELMRVVCPGGVAVIDGELIVKPWPEEMAQWPQHYNTPDNNAVAFDSVVGPPCHSRWIAEPEWQRSHLGLPSMNSLVSAGGRLYSIEDRASVEHPALPGKFALICRDAFNGIELWRHPFSDWQPTYMYVKYTPTQLQRQLAAIGNEIYCTPGLSAPITVFDAATGEILRRLEGTERTQEFVHADGVVYVVAGDPYDTLGTEKAPGGAPLLPAPGTAAAERRGHALTMGPSAFRREAYGPAISQLADPTSSIVAIDAESGQEIWRLKGDETEAYEGATLAVHGSNVVYALKDSLVCVDRETGRRRWRVTAAKGPWFEQNAKQRILGNRNKPGKSPGTTLALVLSDEAVYMAGCNALWAFSLKDGVQMWEALTHINHLKSPDLFLVDGVVWTANKRGYDAHTGELVRELTQNVIGPMSHDRCYRNRITPRWYINSVTGGSDFLALDGSAEFPNHWVRATCSVGYLPCNGLLYLGPHSCSCYNTVKLTAFNALASERGLKTSGRPTHLKIVPRVGKGPAYGELVSDQSSVIGGQWPTYRSDISRGGCTEAAVSAKLEPKWQAQLSPKISPPTIVEGRVFVADVDAHAVRALDVDTGEPLWSYTAGGRVDSPPTWHKGRLLFGSRDGWVYCLRAEDGQLAWRFKGTPEKSICAYEQVESAWPVSGSILVKDDVAYFCAGRNSFLDGGMVLFGLDPETGQLRHRRHLYGPYNEAASQVVMTREEYGHPFGIKGNKGDILSADDQYVYLRHDAFTPDLTPVEATQLKKPHLIATPGFVQPVPHHRSYWTVNTKLLYDIPTGQGPSHGDILVKDGNRFYEVRGYQPSRHDYFDPRTAGYTLFAGVITPEAALARKAAPGRPGRNAPPAGVHQTVIERWKVDIPLTGKAMALAGDVLFVAGTPVAFPEDDLSKAYDGRMGGVLWAASAEDGTKLAEYTLDAPPLWDSMAVVEGKLLLCTADGQLRCSLGKNERRTQTMNRRQLVKATVLVGLIMAMTGSLFAAEGLSKKPNVILIMTDDQGYGDFACLGNPWIDSPNIDQLYADSVRLTDFHVSPMCSPTRAALLAGRHCRHVGLRHTNNCTNLIAHGVPTMADVFAQSGYRTGMFGKWHLGETYPYRPHDRGFHEAVYHGNGAIGTTGDVWGNDYFDDTYFHNGTPKQYSGYCTDVWFAEASQFIQESHADGEPFFCYLAFNVVHGPMIVADEYFLRYRDVEGVFSANAAKMYGMVANLDENMGRLMQLLKSESLDRDTILIFMTDNGTAAGATLDRKGFVRAGYNAGMRGQEGFFIRRRASRPLPSALARRRMGRRTRCPAACCTPGCPGNTRRSLRTGIPKPNARRRYQPETPSGRHGRQVARPHHRRIVQESSDDPAWRLVEGRELYDILADPEQRHDVARQHPEVVRRFQAALAENESGEDTRQQRILLGTQQAPRVSLTIEQWLDEERKYRTFRTNLILQGELFESTVPVEIATGGRYRITLRRWPEQLKTPIRTAIDGGRALKITRAGVRLGTYHETMAVDEKMQSVSFTTELAAGEADLRAWFVTESQQRLGAYFVDIQRLP